MQDWHIHGGRIDAARAAFPGAPAPWLDLSTGINPVAWDVACAGPINWRALPGEQALRDLEAAAAAHFGAPPDRVCALPGSEAGLRLLDRLGLPGPFAHVARGYRTHEEAFADARAIDAGEVPAAVAAGGTLLLANPDNPTGRLLPPGELRALADAAAARGGRLVIDEAFADAVPGASILSHRMQADRCIVLRSFGKFFGLAGVRLGFLVAPPAIVAGARAALGAWPVSAAAIAIGTAAYRDGAWIAATRAALPARAAALDALLARHGLVAEGACPLFRLVRSVRACALFDRLARAGILVRPFDHSPDWLRFGVPADAQALARLDRALG